MEKLVIFIMREKEMINLGEFQELVKGFRYFEAEDLSFVCFQSAQIDLWQIVSQQSLLVPNIMYFYIKKGNERENSYQKLKRSPMERHTQTNDGHRCLYQSEEGECIFNVTNKGWGLSHGNSFFPSHFNDDTTK
jgi:hypothetical protein